MVNDIAFDGQVALVTGAASGIGRACTEAFLAQGASVVGLDINPAVETLIDDAHYLGLTCDLRDEAAVRLALARANERFGGLNIVVGVAGIFPDSKPMIETTLADWRKVMAVNVDAYLVLLTEAHPYLKQADDGRVVLIGSKTVKAPGKNSVAYSVSKTALTQMARIAAIEWAGDGIRVNVIHPNRVMDTGLWNEDLLEARAASYGLTVAEYRRENMLHVEVLSRDVADLTLTICGPAFAKITGAQIPLDGGNDRVI